MHRNMLKMQDGVAIVEKLDSISVDITVYQYEKNLLYSFYNIAQNITLLQRMSNGKFSVFTLSYVNMAPNQSAFRIRKSYIVNFNVIQILERYLNVIN